MSDSLYPRVTLKERREQSWLFGHPWIYSRAIQKAPNVPAGSLVSVYSYLQQPVGIAIFHPKQSIALRMLTPLQEQVDSAWFYNRLMALKKYKESLLEPDTTAYRWCFGESDGLPGLILDMYNGAVAVQINAKGMEHLLPLLLDALPRCGVHAWYVEANSISAKKEGILLPPPSTKENVWAKENNLEICIPFGYGQKTGWFCDQRDNRRLVQEIVRRQKLSSVLNLFSYTGGFGLNALAGGANRVVNVDQDGTALSLLSKMVERNKLTGISDQIVANVWEYLSTCRETFDLVIADPPAFVKEEEKKGAGLKGYRDLFKCCLPKVSPGGFLMLYSCSHFVSKDDLSWILRQLFAESGRRFQTVTSLTQGSDHPIPVWFPEADYLKGFLLKEILR